jgi:hypothetical protein
VDTAGPVDGGRSADASALKNLDRLVGGVSAGGLLVEHRVGFGLEHPEVAARPERAFLDDDDLEAGSREKFGRHAATRATADDHHVGLERLVGDQSGSIDMVPACCESFTERVAHHSTFGGPRWPMAVHVSARAYHALKMRSRSAA